MNDTMQYIKGKPITELTAIELRTYINSLKEKRLQMLIGFDRDILIAELALRNLK